MIPSDMNSELQAWNNGAGISLENWIGCEGNLKLAVGYTTLFWPQFKLVDDYIVRESCEPENLKAFEIECKGDKKAVEAVINHVHLSDVHWYGSPDTTKDRLKFLMPILKEIYEAKLMWQFPNQPCTVSLIFPEEEDNLEEYQITFWQKKNEPLATKT